MDANRYLLSLVLLILLGSIISACSNDIDTNMSETVEDFSFTTQDEETLTLSELKGNWWLAYLSYTNCRTVCPRTTENMVDIQNKLKKDNIHPQIISFTVDPENDTPKDLREYAKKHDIDLSSWDFLTGYSFETIQKLSENTFHAILERGATDQMSHSYMFYLINPDGEVVKKYDGMGESDLDLLVDDVKTILK